MFIRKRMKNKLSIYIFIILLILNIISITIQHYRNKRLYKLIDSVTKLIDFQLYYMRIIKQEYNLMGEK